MTVGAKIGAGRTAEIFEWNAQQIIKLYMPGYPTDAIQREAALARAAFQADVQTPAVGDLVEIEDRTGLIFDRVQGAMLIDHLQSKPWRVRSFARDMAALHVSLHRVTGPGVRSQRDTFGDLIQRRFTGDQQTRLLAYLDGLPDGNTLCHGDFHPENIILTENGPVIIDWMNGAQGHPLADVARTVLLLTIGTSPDAPVFKRLLIGVLRRQFHQAYLAEYCRLSGAVRSEIDRWMPIVAAARISDQISGEEAHLQALIAPIVDP